MAEPRPMLVVVAHDGEWAEWRSSLGLQRPLRSGELFRFGGDDPWLALLCTGVGLAETQRSVEQIASLRPALVLHAGFAGGLRAGLNAGDVVVVTGTSETAVTPAAADQLPSPLPVDAEIVNLLRSRLAELPDRMGQGPLLTVDRFVDRAESKAGMGGPGAWLACDMEAAVVRAATEAAGARYAGVRAVSDAADQDVPPTMRDAGGRLSPRKVLRWASRPAAGGEVVRLVRGARRARAALGRALPAATEALGPLLQA